MVDVSTKEGTPYWLIGSTEITGEDVLSVPVKDGVQNHGWGNDDQTRNPGNRLWDGRKGYRAGNGRFWVELGSSNTLRLLTNAVDRIS